MKRRLECEFGAVCFLNGMPMTLRRKALIACIILAIVNSLVATFWIEAVYLVGGDFNPQTDSEFLPPNFWTMIGGASLLICLSSIVVYWLAIKNIIAPLDNIAESAESIESGNNVVMRGINRQDEIGRIAVAFNLLSSKTVAARETLQQKVTEAVTEAENNQKVFAMAERYTATGRLAGRIVEQLSSNLGEAAEAVSRLKNRDMTPEMKTEQITILDDCIRDLQNSIRDIFYISRRKKEVGPASASAALRAAVGMSRHLLDKYRIALIEEIEEPGRNGEDKLTVSADTGDLMHVFMNLIINAIDAMPRGGVLTVRASRVLKWVIVEVVDTGIGLTIDEVSASFDYFHTTKQTSDNHGLGLSVAQHIVTGYGGALTLNSRKGEGTKATVELPAASKTVFRTSTRTARRGGTRTVRNTTSLRRADNI